MISTIYDKFCYLMSIEPTEKNESEIREEINVLLVRLHAFYDQQQLESNCALHDIERACHHRLRLLQNRLLCHSKDGQQYVCDIKELIENICCACDLVLSGLGREVVFDCSEEDILISCMPNIVSSMMLNMISNACLHTQTPTIKVSLRQTDAGVVIKTHSLGKIDFLKLKHYLENAGSGSSAILCAARLHNARVMWGNNDDSACVAVCLPPGELCEEYYTPPDFVELLCDRLSPIYTGLCGII